jgi:hypothetical protein
MERSPKEIKPEPPKVGACDCCQTDDVEVKTYNLRFEGSKSMGGEDRELCTFCAYSFIANAYQYPSQASISQLAQSMGAVANQIVKSINKPLSPLVAPRVLVTVHGGMAEAVCDPGVNVVILDYDVENSEESFEDADGVMCEQRWVAEGGTHKEALDKQFEHLKEN